MFWKRRITWVSSVLFCCGVTHGWAQASIVTVTAPLDTAKYEHWSHDGSKHPIPAPPISMTLRQQSGSVGLRVESDKDGSVRAIAITHPSGFPALDETAKTWVKYVWRYPEAKKSSVHQETINFQGTSEDKRSAESIVSAARTILPNFPRPLYPQLAWHLHWQGTVGLLLSSDGEGRVKNAKIVKSSGFRWLDVWTQDWAEACWKLPNKADTPVSIVYQLR